MTINPKNLPFGLILNEIIDDSKAVRNVVDRLFFLGESYQNVISSFIDFLIDEQETGIIPPQYLIETAMATEWIANKERSTIHLSGDAHISGIPDIFAYPNHLPKSFVLTVRKGVTIQSRGVPPILVYYLDKPNQLGQTFINAFQHLDFKLGERQLGWAPPEKGTLYIGMSAPYGDSREGKRMFKELTPAMIDIILSADTVDAYNSMRGDLPLIDDEPAQAEFDFQVVQLVLAVIHHMASTTAPKQRLFSFKLKNTRFPTTEIII